MFPVRRYIFFKGQKSVVFLCKEQGGFSFPLKANEPSQGVQHSQEYGTLQAKGKATSSTGLWAPSPLFQQSETERRNKEEARSQTLEETESSFWGIKESCFPPFKASNLAENEQRNNNMPGRTLWEREKLFINFLTPVKPPKPTSNSNNTFTLTF